MSDVTLVRLSWVAMKTLLAQKVYGIPVYYAIDDDGRCHTWPLSNWNDRDCADEEAKP